MEKSSKVIEYEAYVRYLRKVTGRCQGMDNIRDDVMRKTVSGTELQTLWASVRRAGAVAVILLSFGLTAGVAVYFSGGDESADEVSVWKESRKGRDEHKSHFRLYEAYKHTASLRNEFIHE